MRRVAGAAAAATSSWTNTIQIPTRTKTTTIRTFSAETVPKPAFALPPLNYNLRRPALSRSTPMSEEEIEQLHEAALARQSTTYVDPTTGFLVFTELAHLQRGQCCGNVCRHCPYGWEHVANPAVRRPASLKSGDKVAIRARLQDIEDLAKQQPPPPPPNFTASTTTTTTATKTGGRHGGRLTKKNVPYTRGGDKGTSQLLTGERRSKADDAFEAMGTVDELCSFVGVVHAQLMHDAAINPELLTSTSATIDIRDQLLEIMSRLFDIGSHVAKPAKVPQKGEDNDSESTDDDDEGHGKPKKSSFLADGIGGGFDPLHVQELEDWVDQLTEDLPELNSFLLPTGSLAAAHLHTARCVCRRAERCMVPLVQAGVCDPTALQYVNRLSDYLFSASRWVNLVEAKQDEIQYRRPHRGAKQRLRVAQRKEG